MKHSLFLALVFLLTFARANVFSLSELPWTLKNQNGSIAVPGSVPSSVHLDLHRAGLISEPLLGVNDFTQRWIVDDNWTYTADISPFLRSFPKVANQKTLLVFYGIDTIANITLGNHLIAWVNNQFMQYVYDVSELLSPINASANLTVALESAWHYGLNVTSRPDAEPLAVSQLDFEYPGVRNYIRKTQSDFGWDWGPAFVPSGIHKPAYFITLSPPSSPTRTPDATEVYISETSVDIFKQGSKIRTGVPPNQQAPWVVNVTLGIHSLVSSPNAILTLSIPELAVTSRPIPAGEILPASPLPGSRLSVPTWLTALWTIDDQIPQRWYPHNLGNPTLYTLSISLDLNLSNSSLQVHNPITFQTRVGFRTIRLAQTRYPDAEIEQHNITPGDQWHFEVNGKAFYALGTNIIPFDPFYARVTNDQVRWVLESAVRSGQNMLRVWGGGLYQPSSSSASLTPTYPPHSTDVYSFYSTCDELGIMTWSEFIFADYLYPVNDWFISSVEQEVAQNVRRINKHVSNVEWAGGNENELVIDVVNQTYPQPVAEHLVQEFLALYEDILHDAAYDATNSIPYVDCSTTGGVLNLDPLALRFTQGKPGEIYGNTERYNYDASQAFNYSTFPVARFVNEFGFHSMPSFYSWQEVLTSPDDFSFNSTVVASRDHHPPAGGLTFPNPNAAQGQGQMTEAVELWLPTPNTSDSNQTFAQWAWSTQVFQAMAMQSQIAFYRLGAGLPNNNLGALVWQLNDIWQGISWSAIEYSGRWKVLQYALTSAFQSVVINPFWSPETEILEIVATSDRWDTVHASAQWTWYDWHGRVLNTTQRTFSIPPLNNSVLFHATGLENFLPHGKNASDVWLRLNVTAQIRQNKLVINEQYFVPTSLASASLIDPCIVFSHDGDLNFTLSAKCGVAPWTWLDHPAGSVGVFIDARTGTATNGFYLIPGEDRTVTFLPSPAGSRSKIPQPADFVVRSLWNNTHL
ncbi:glycoside hydrolase family 2 protein [Auriscalpium vulgare]|uniref:Glycoside hydrolase family 2 protein n=1 Tax=Auriscalpium vulgare TaxID=40419 RepID=A0ACB8RV28_9AGAM|nr:glycoside hydrolase family 2 protein [Auriscalpium vulgare]